jgi:hypothetical protein
VERKKWGDLTARQRATIIVVGAVQIALFALVQRDIGRRAPHQLRGPKWAWRLAAAVNWIGPLAYFTVGRRRGSPPTPA